MLRFVTMEHWNRAYREAPEIFDAFTRAEDPDGLVVRRLLEEAALGGRRILEIGSGTGRYTEALAAGTEFYIALEKSPPMLSLARRRFAASTTRPCMLCATAERIPLRSESVDHVIAGWVLVNMRGATRSATLREIDRVLIRGVHHAGHELGAAWLLENHWTGEFQELRGRHPEVERERIQTLMTEGGFQIVDTIETELRFSSATEAERILGYLCGEKARDRLRQEPRSRLSHRILILRRGAPA